MRGSLERAALAVLAGCGGAAVFAGGGGTPDTLLWVGGAALVAVLAAAAGAAAGFIPLPKTTRLGEVCLLLSVLLVGWIGASIAWSLAPDRAWDYLNRGLAYLALILVGLLVGALPGAPRRMAQTLVLVGGATLAWALLGKIVPAVYPDGGRIARLRSPIGYWNALALLFALTVPAALWLATDSWRRRVAPLGGAMLVYGLGVGLLLTYSRGGLLVAILAVAAWLVLGQERLRSAVLILAATPPALAVGIWAFDQPGIAADGQSEAVRRDAGTQLGVALAVGAAACVALAFALVHVRADERAARVWRATRPRRVGLIAAIAVALIASVLAVSQGGDLAGWARAQGKEFANPPSQQVAQDPSRLGSVNSNNRWTWWKEAWTAFRAEPLRGTGAGSFPFVHRRLRDSYTTTTAPHNEALRFLAETGFVGFLLAGAAAITACLAAWRRRARARGSERGAVTVLVLAVSAYCLHALVDWDLDFLAVTAPVLLCVGVLLGEGARAPFGNRMRLAAATGLVALLLLGLVSLAAPWLAKREVDGAYAALGAGDTPRGLARAERAARLDPLSIDPLLARAQAELALGQQGAARGAYVRAVELQPQSPDAWYALGYFEYKVAGRPEAALPYVRRAWLLDRVTGIALLNELNATLRANG